MAYNEDGSPTLDDLGRHQHKYRYIINEGSSRSSKTFSMIDCYDLYARENKYKRLTVWRDTKADCKRTVLKDAVKHFRKTGRYKKGQTFNKSESIFTYTTSSTFEIHGTDDEDTVHGLTQDCAWLNEPYKISEEVFNQIDQRTSDFIFIDWNPKKDWWINNLKKDPRTLVIYSTFKDNPMCPPEQRTKILSYQPIKFSFVVTTELMNVHEARDYDVISNTAGIEPKYVRELIRCRENEYKRSANDFNWQVYGLGIKAEKPHRIFHWEEMPLFQYQQIDGKVWYGVDWGTVDPWGIVEAKYYDGNLYLRELNYDSENKVREKLTEAEWDHVNARDEGLVKWMFEKLGVDKNRLIICDNNRESKVLALRDVGFNASAITKLKGSKLDGIDLLNNMRVYYTSESAKIAWESENYSRKVDARGVVLEEPQDNDDHLMDAVRYIAIMLQQLHIIKKA